MLATAPVVSANTAVSLIPARSIQQRREALLRANQIRVYRALVKRRIKARAIDARSLLREPHRDPITGQRPTASSRCASSRSSSPRRRSAASRPTRCSAPQRSRRQRRSAA
jgi:hypothetical protein